MAAATSVPAHHSAGSSRQPDLDIDEGFRLLEANPQRVLTATAALLTKHLGDPRDYARVVELKAQALFLLNDFDGCVEYVNSLSQDLQNTQEMMMIKARALQAKGHLVEALSLFQFLYVRYTASFEDRKTYGLAMSKHLQLMGGMDNLKAALDIYTRLRTEAAGRMNTPSQDQEIEQAMSVHLRIMGGRDNLRKALGISTRLMDIPASNARLQ
ncbi:hypothetical protein [Sansalvadorimonas verongulae]|uniref:hypothetical protein n=1 Tax=Sansalvadorimonas verongulae TaxID=2172824 RepID=UPI0012BBEBB7|nr:hypothetical protein [Sansalvadorimonas verongulae]MTI14092.1 hypothetical protein [Sansalvadorimonas verongulae]